MLAIALVDPELARYISSNFLLSAISGFNKDSPYFSRKLNVIFSRKLNVRGRSMPSYKILPYKLAGDISQDFQKCVITWIRQDPRFRILEKYFNAFHPIMILLPDLRNLFSELDFTDKVFKTKLLFDSTSMRELNRIITCWLLGGQTFYCRFAYYFPPEKAKSVKTLWQGNFDENIAGVSR